MDGVAIVDRNGKLIKQVASHGPPSSDPLLDSRFGAPVWSPSGKALAHVDSVGDDTVVYIVNIASGKSRKLSNGPAEPAWSVRNRIALSGFELDTVWPDGKRPRTLYRGETLGPDWSPGGRQIVFADSNGLSTIKSSGKGRKRLRIGKGDPQDPKWSPNGKIVIWVQFRRRTPVLRALNRRTGRVRTIMSRVLNPDWQPRPRRSLRGSASARNPG